MTYANNTYTRAKIPTDAPFSDWLADMLQARSVGRCPIGLNVRQEVNYADVLAYVKKLGGVKVMLFHCDASTLWRLKDFVPHVDMLIWRPREYTSEDLWADYSPRLVRTAIDDWLTVQQNAMRAAGFNDGDLWLHLHNEAQWTISMIDWERQAIETGVPRGMKFVALNQAVGNPPESAIPLARPILELAGQHPEQVVIGIHDGYFSVYGHRKYPWYLGRWQATFDNGYSFESYRISEGLPGVRYVITEAGAEDISDDHPYTSTLPKVSGKSHIGPVHTLDAAWRATYHSIEHNSNPRPYPGLDRAYVDQIDTASDVGRWLDPRVMGVCLFSWGNKETRWVDYDLSSMGAFVDELAAWWQRTGGTDVITPPPVETAYVRATLQSAKGYAGVNLRKAMTTKEPPLAYIQTGTVLDFKPDSRTSNEDNIWYQVRTDTGLEGYMALVGNQTVDQQFVRVVIPTPEPPIDDEDTQPGAQTYVTHSEHDAALTALETRLEDKYLPMIQQQAKEIRQLQDALRAILAASTKIVDDLPKAS